MSHPKSGPAGCLEAADHESMPRQVKVPVLFTHHFRQTEWADALTTSTETER
ncbi:hypothetical protein [Streptomyces sp. NPDC051572]|uniref:hypothetical protein n=1 Tax=unclassified Streptomyces TaxID=2593676 RepID=UPI00344E8314